MPNTYGNLGFPSQYPLFQIKTSDDQIPYNLNYNDLQYLYDTNNFNLTQVSLPQNMSMYPVYQLIPKYSYNYEKTDNNDYKDKNYYYNKYLKYKNKYLNLLKKQQMNNNTYF